MKTQTRMNARKALKTIGLMSLFMIVMVAFNPLNAQSSERTVKGIVADQDGPLIGATVVLKGTSVGVATDEKGEFTFPQQLKEGDVLVVSYLGYKKQEVTITGDITFIDFFLGEDQIDLYGAMIIEDTSKNKEPDH